MTNTLRVKRRASGAPGSPSSLLNGELAYNEVDDVLYYGKGTGGAGGSASVIEAIAGKGAYLNISGNQTVTGEKTFSGAVIVPTPTLSTHAATKAYVDNSLPSLSGTNGIQYNSGVIQIKLNSTSPGLVADTNGLSVSLSATHIPSIPASKISDFDTQVRTSRIDQLAVPTSSISLNSNKIINLATPVDPADAATKAYVDSHITGGMSYKGTVSGSGSQPVAPAAGDMYRVAEAGSSAYGFQVNVGDFVIFNGSTWDKIDSTDPTIVGTSGKIVVTPVSDTSYQVDLSSSYVGQSSITTVGTISSGSWNATNIPVAKGGTGLTSVLSGVVKGNGSSYTAAVAGTDYLAPDSIIDGGTF